MASHISLASLAAVAVILASMVDAQATFPGYPASGYPQPAPASFRCPQPNGFFPMSGDCSRYYYCRSSVPTLSSCPAQLVFNPVKFFCDWPYNVPACSGQSAKGVLKPDLTTLCNPTNKLVDPFSVRHPRLCNAFFTCVPGYMFRRCSFCAPGTYFDEGAGHCLRLGLRAASEVCGRSTYVEAKDIASKMASDDCWAMASEPNPLASIANLKPQNNPGYSNPTYNNPTYNNVPVNNAPINNPQPVAQQPNLNNPNTAYNQFNQQG